MRNIVPKVLGTDPQFIQSNRSQNQPMDAVDLHVGRCAFILQLVLIPCVLALMPEKLSNPNAKLDLPLFYPISRLDPGPKHQKEQVWWVVNATLSEVQL